MSVGEGSPPAGKMRGSIPITRRTQRCPWLGPRWLEVARPHASVAMPVAPPAAGRFGDHGGHKRCAGGVARARYGDDTLGWDGERAQQWHHELLLGRPW